MFVQESVRMKDEMMDIWGPWWELVHTKIKIGRLLLGYLGRVMEGELTGDPEECRDLYLQGVHLTCQVNALVTKLETKIHTFREEWTS